MVLRLVLVFAMSGCSTAASIERTRDLTVKGEILGGSPDSIIVQTNTGVQLVTRSQVSKITHPGHVPIAVGLGLLAVGAVSIAVAMSTCTQKADGPCVGFFVPAVVGGLMVAGGSLTAVTSMLAADDTSDAAGVERIKAKAAAAPPKKPNPEHEEPADDDD